MAKKIANATTTAQLLDQVARRMAGVHHKTATSFNSVSNTEEHDPEQHVTSKLQHKGEDYANAEETSYGKQITRDLMGQGPNVGPLPDKASSDQPEDRSSKNDTKSNPLYDVFDSVGEPEDTVDDPGTQGDPVSEKLQLKKDASAILTRMDDNNRQGQRIIDLLMAATVDNKQASVPQPAYTPDDLITESTQRASVAVTEQVKSAMVNMVDEAIYAAEAVALQLKQADAEQSANSPDHKTAGTPPKTPALKPLLPQLPRKAANATPPEESHEEPPTAGVGGEQAMVAMSAPAPAAEDGGAPPISDEDAQALMAQSLTENGVDPSVMAGDAGEMGGGMEGGMEDGMGEDMGLEISPEEIAAFEQAMAQVGITPEEIEAAIAELAAEDEAGITSEQGMLADEEAAKTGHYKFASFIRRPATKTAQQEQRAAVIRGAIRDFLLGPGTSNFN